MQDIPDTPLRDADARTLRFLRLLVLVLTSVMIVGMVVLVVLFATRFPGSARTGATNAALTAGVQIPSALRIPEGAVVSAVTQAAAFWIVVTDAGGILFYAPEGGDPVRQVAAPQ